MEEKSRKKIRKYLFWFCRVWFEVFDESFTKDGRKLCEVHPWDGVSSRQCSGAATPPVTEAPGHLPPCFEEQHGLPERFIACESENFGTAEMEPKDCFKRVVQDVRSA